MYCVLPPLFVLKDVLFSLFCEMGTQLHGANRVYQPLVNPLSGVTSVRSQLPSRTMPMGPMGPMVVCFFSKNKRWFCPEIGYL